MRTIQRLFVRHAWPLTLASLLFLAPPPASAQEPGRGSPDMRAGEDSASVRAPRQDTVPRDAWGQQRNLGLAIAEAFVADVIPWTFNELVPARSELKITQISPRSWWRNIEEGWKWDDNNFPTNHFAHPFQGNLYYTSARANGYGYWTGLLFALAGSFHWECCGETHLMSINDWGNTSLGGAAVGEMLYRSSSMILDNRATGSGRVWREIGAGLLVPARGITRLVTGNTSRVYDNPVNANDHIPEFFEGLLTLGVRTTQKTLEARNGTTKDELPQHGFLDFAWIYGKQTELERNTPYDYFEAEAKINFVKGRGLGQLSIRGNLWRKNLSSSESGSSTLLVMQDFEYENTMAFEHGGQSFTLEYVREHLLSERTSIRWNVGGSFTVMGGVESDLALLANVEGVRERLREYDFGVGPGASAHFEWRRNGFRLVDASYDLQYLITLNGANVDAEDIGTLNSRHSVHLFRIKAVAPFSFRGIGLGAAFEGFTRRSNYESDIVLPNLDLNLGLVKERATALELFLVFNPRSDSN